MKRPYKIESLLRSNGRQWFVAVEHEGATVQLLSATECPVYMEEAFGDFIWHTAYDETLTKAQNITNAQLKFEALWSIWKNQNQDNWNRMYDAIVAEYSPIENVDEYIDAHTETVEMHKGSKTTSTPGVKTTTIETPRAEVENKQYIYGGNDGNTGAPDARSVSKGINGTNRVEVEQVGNNITATTDIDSQTFDKNVSIANPYHRHGNIGVTKSTELVESEIALREGIQLGFKCIADFIKTFCYYSSEEEGI